MSRGYHRPGRAGDDHRPGPALAGLGSGPGSAGRGAGRALARGCAGSALAVTLSFLLPPALALPAAAQEAGAIVFLCRDGSEPPCAQGAVRGRPHLVLEDGTVRRLTRDEIRAAREAGLIGGEEAEALAEGAEAEQEAERATQAEREAEAEARAEQEAAERATQAEREAQAQAEQEAEREAEREAADHEAAEREAQAERAAQAEAEARAEQEAAEQEARAEAEARAEREAQAQAAAEARAAARAEEAAQRQAERAARREALQAEREAVARAAAEADAAARQAAEEQARAAALAQSEAEAEAARQAAERAAEEATRAERRARREAQAAAAAAADIDTGFDIVLDERAQAEAEVEAGAEAGRPEASVEVEMIREEDVRTSAEDYETDPAGREREPARREDQDDDDDGLSDFEKLLLLGLGAVAVGAILDNGQEVVAATGDRVVARDVGGELIVLRDDDAILRQPGTLVRTETFADGSTRTILEREDGTRVVTIRAADGRVLRRARVLPDGTQVELFNDIEEPAPVNVVRLIDEAPRPVMIEAEDYGIETLAEIIRREPGFDIGRSFSLRQIREIAAVRNLVPAVDLDITFPTGSAAIPADQLPNLVELGLLIEDFIFENPGEVFLVEGHTDATGDAAYNLALSDRRAETVALALVENFDIPPENLVVQGYGEEFLKVPTLAAEAENRRATIRRITPLLGISVAAAIRP